MNITDIKQSPPLRWWPRLMHVLFKRHYSERCYHLVHYFGRPSRWRHHCLLCEVHLYHESVTVDGDLRWMHEYRGDIAYRSRGPEE